MEEIYLVKIGEILLKSGNRHEFEECLKINIKRRLSNIPNRISIHKGRYFIEVDENNRQMVENCLAKTPGINGYALAYKCEKNMEEIYEAAIMIAKKESEKGITDFKIESRRSDKSFFLDSYALSAKVGEKIIESVSSIKVNVKNPHLVINIEIREKAYIYGHVCPGQKGLPVGVSGKSLLLLSGGIDSPIAGWMMAKRGLAIEALYFHAYPYTSDNALEKVKKLALLISEYTGKIKLHVAPFTDVQLAIKKNSREEQMTLYMRGAMMQIANRLACSIGAKSIITGESLGQVASQTAENIGFTGSFTKLPILRPLIGINKEDTIEMARNIGTYETSILPYEDCCTLFSPKHPVLKADQDIERTNYLSMNLEPELEKCFENIRTCKFHYGTEVSNLPS